MNRRTRKPAPTFSNFGFSTILLAFVMICIVTISALSLMTANSDYKLSQKVAEKNSTYFDAEAKAYEILANVDSTLATAYATTSTLHGYWNTVENNLSSMEEGIFEASASGYTYSYEIRISDRQSLCVVLQLQYPTSSEDTFYTIDTWQSKYEVVEFEEDNLNLIQ